MKITFNYCFIGNAVATGITIKFKDTEGQMQSVQLDAVENTNKRQSMSWVAALQKVMHPYLNQIPHQLLHIIQYVSE